MRNMFRVVAEKLRMGESLVLVTVIASSGAAPRGAGARMLVGTDGRICGTIGGGAVELRSEHIAISVLNERRSDVYHFSLTKNDVQDLGMICGGEVNVFFHYIPAGDANTILIAEEIESHYNAGEDLWLILEISDGGSLGLYSKKKGFFDIDVPDWVSGLLPRHSQRQMCEGRDFYIEQIYTSGKVYIFGCGHVAQELVPVLQHLDFRCVAMDDRPEFASPSVIPSAESVILIDFEKIADFVTIRDEDYVCIMTRGHAFDLTVQVQILKTPACYIGVIGSAAKKASVYNRLYEMGFTKADTDRITSPIGLAIKAETPAEIAISIAGQMIEQRALRNAR